MVKRNTQTGFTIVELIVVIVVIAILAAITIIGYSGIRDSAYDSSVESDLRNNRVAMRLFKADNNGVFPKTSAQLTAAKLSFSKDAYFTGNKANIYYCINDDATQYAFVAQSKSGKRFQFDSISTQIKEYTASVAWAPDAASWANTCKGVGSDFLATGSLTGMSNGNWTAWAK